MKYISPLILSLSLLAASPAVAHGTGPLPPEPKVRGCNYTYTNAGECIVWVEYTEGPSLEFYRTPAGETDSDGTCELRLQTCQGIYNPKPANPEN